MEPVINDFAAKYTDVEFVKIDVDELDVRSYICSYLYNPFLFSPTLLLHKWILISEINWKQKVAEEYGVQAMPTFVLIKKGKVVDKVVGADKDGLKKKIEKHRCVLI